MKKEELDILDYNFRIRLFALMHINISDKRISTIKYHYNTGYIWRFYATNTIYGLRSLIYLSIHRDKLIPMPTIAQHYGISANHLMKVTQQLTRLGYIESKNGRNGGLRLIRNPKHINISQVIMDLEPLEIIECFEQNGFCVIEPACRLKGVLASALRAFLKELEKYTLDELIQNSDELAFYLKTSSSRRSL